MIFGTLLYASMRYIKQAAHLTGYIIHVVLGILVTLVTVWKSFEALVQIDWTITFSTHTIFGIGVLAIILFLAALGSIRIILGF